MLKQFNNNTSTVRTTLLLVCLGLFRIFTNHNNWCKKSYLFPQAKSDIRVLYIKWEVCHVVNHVKYFSMYHTPGRAGEK